MSAKRPPTGPAEFESVEIVDRLSASRVSAIVERANDRSFVLRLHHEARVPEEAFLRWFDGASAWQSIARMMRIDESHVQCELAPSHEWEASPSRRSTRVRVENAPLLVSILPGSRRVHAVCVEISDTGCRANWLGETPRVGDAVDIAWLADPARSGSRDRVRARVARVLSRPFGAHHVCFSFEMADATQAALVHDWHQASLEHNRQRRHDEHAA